MINPFCQSENPENVLHTPTIVFSANLAGSYNLIVDKYTIKRSISQFSKIVICIRSFLLILYHSITTKVVAIHIQTSKGSDTGRFPLSLLYHF